MAVYGLDGGFILGASNGAAMPHKYIFIMVMFYKAVQSSLPNKEGKKLFYPSLVKVNNVVTTQDLAEKIAYSSSMTEGDVHGVIRNLMVAMRQELLNSQTVKLDGLGSFTFRACAKGKGVETAEEVDPSQIKLLRCHFTPEGKRNGSGGTTRAMTTGIKYQRADGLSGVTTDDLEIDGGGGGNGGNTGGAGTDELG